MDDDNNLAHNNSNEYQSSKIESDERPMVSKKRKLSLETQEDDEEGAIIELDETNAGITKNRDDSTPPSKRQATLEEIDQRKRSPQDNLNQNKVISSGNDSDNYESDNEPLPPVPQAPRHPTQAIEADEEDADQRQQSNREEEGSVEEGEVGDEDEEGQLSEDEQALSNRGQDRYPNEPANQDSPSQRRREGSQSNFPIGSRTQSHGPRFVGCSPVTDYSFNKKIGEGTFGEVVIGKHKTTGQTVALKKVLIHNEKEGVPITALREIKILKAIEHPNVIHLNEIAFKRGDKHGHKRDRGVIFMVFPYMDHDLSGLLENPKVWLSPAMIKSYIQQLLRGVNYLHKSHILHRDMKGANILIDNKGHLKIADFGLARTFADEDLDREDACYTNMVVTRWYRPPELFMGATRYGPAVDIWGVGCVFGEMLKRRPIITGHDDRDQLEKIFQLCGVPSEQTWPGYRDHRIFKIPESEGGIERFKVLYRRSIDERFPSNHFDRYTVKFLDELLTLDPRRRPSASEALRHRYFDVYPPPAEPNTDDFKPFPTSHELDTRNFRAERIKAAESSGGKGSAAHHLPHHHDANISDRDHSRYGSSRDTSGGGGYTTSGSRGSSYRPSDDHGSRRYDSYRSR